MSWTLFWIIVAVIAVFCLLYWAISEIPTPPAPPLLKPLLKILLGVVTAAIIAVRLGLLHG